ncbi:MAG: tRNA (5-methylaminomethyl-2-thiouridylate)-methyltransferase [Candidatus Cloacimonetes bacterium]|nr:tRNA (5-methylaminomethyl-2-thiouridylate)-methyltransferase [Candidatus Cloacimonadota bacterium]
MALFSGGLDSVLAVFWMQHLGYEVIPVFFEAAYIFPNKALKVAEENGLELLVRDISQKHLEMLRNPKRGYGKNLNPCIDCHSLMIQEAAMMLPELNVDFIITGEVLGQRPMSQNLDSLKAIDKMSGAGDLVIRPLSQKLLPDTRPIREGWINKEQMLDISGRGRSRQLQLAEQFGISHLQPAGGCLLTDHNYSRRLRDLINHNQDKIEDVRLLYWGRHFRLSEEIKLIVGRNATDNAGLESENYPGLYLKIRDVEGPLALLTVKEPPAEILELAASIVLFYSRKASSPGYIKYGVDKKFNNEIKVEKCPENIIRSYLISS